MKRHYVIYLPGLGDDTFGPIQTALLKFWKIYGLETSYHYIGWGNGEAFPPKLERILAAIDEHARDHTVSLIGTSAGRLPAAGHAASIFYALTLGSPRIVRIIKRS